MIGSGAYDTVGSGAVHAVGGWAGLAGQHLPVPVNLVFALRMFPFAFTLVPQSAVDLL